MEKSALRMLALYMCFNGTGIDHIRAQYWGDNYLPVVKGLTAAVGSKMLHRH